MNRSRSVIAWCLLAIAAQTAVASATMSRRIFFGGPGPEKMGDDVRIFREYADRTFRGEVPYRDFTVEYPLFSLPLFLLPRLVTGEAASYRIAFAIEMLAIQAIVVFLVARHLARADQEDRIPSRLAWTVAFFAALCPLAVTKFDAGPAALALVACLLWSSGRGVSGGILAGVGALTMVFPCAVAIPFVSAGLRRGRTRGGVATVLTTALGFALWFAIGGAGVARSLNYHLERGIEVESLSSGLVAGWAWLNSSPMSTKYTHFSIELVAPGADLAAKATLVLQLAALLAVAIRAYRTDLRDPLRDAAGAVVGFLTFGKVLSPQYLIWPIGLIALVRGSTGRLARPVFLAACLSTTLVYPWSIDRLVVLHPRALAILNGRNLLLVALWFLLLLGPEPPTASRTGGVDRAGIPG